MNIKRAKEEIKHTIAAYLERDEKGNFRIPPIRQRPVLLMGPPGIGKTQIMEQIAVECSLPLVSYTITHHTRQSAIGLPYIREKVYDGRVFSVTEYTMSEIIASMYDRMEESGKKEGLLFIDEINCVSETLAPTMLQFLQGKTFGNQKVPEGWMIVAAGNPPEYNKSVRDFDVVTLDRVKVINVEANFPVWKEYAYETGLHGAVIAYLNIHKENFYRMETTVDGKQFVTARGWEDLSELLYSYERLGFEADRDVTVQYLQQAAVAKDFANYLELYYKYKSDYQVDEILSGTIRPGTLNKLKFAPFDERLQVVSLLLTRLSENFRRVREEDVLTGQLFTRIKHAQTQQADADADSMAPETAAEGAGKEEDPASLREQFMRQNEKYEQLTDEAARQLEYAFDFMEAAFGEGQEMVVFITELSVNQNAVAFLKGYDCDRYYMYNKSLLFADREKDILNQLDQIRDMQIT